MRKRIVDERMEIFRALERLGGTATPEELLECLPQYQKKNGEEAFYKHTKAMVDEGILEYRFDAESFPMKSVFAIVQR